MLAELSGPHRGHAHHVLGRKVTGDDPRYIVAACQHCNLKVGDPTKYANQPHKPILDL